MTLKEVTQKTAYIPAPAGTVAVNCKSLMTMMKSSRSRTSIGVDLARRSPAAPTNNTLHHTSIEYDQHFLTARMLENMHTSQIYNTTEKHLN